MNHVLVDFENVHEIDLSIIGMKSVSFTLLLGAQQKRLDAELVETLMEHATSVQLVRLTSSGRNALTFSAPAPTPPKPSVPPATNDSLTRALTHLRRNTKNRPKRNRTLESHLLAHFGKGATAVAITTLIERLQQAGYIRIDEKGAVTYHL